MMKVVPNAALIAKCDSNNIENFDITYMNKVNRTLNSNAKTVAKSQPEEDIQFSKSQQLPKGCDIKSLDEEEDGEVEAACLESLSYELSASVGEAVSCEKRLAINESLSSGDSGVDSTASSWDKSVTELKEHTYVKLEEELQHARQILKLRDDEVSRLRQMRQDGDQELLELTASLFEEAHSMVNNANVKRAAAEKALKESLMKVEVLSAEVIALKTLVLTSTPSKPNLHSHNQTYLKAREDMSFLSNGTTYMKKHHRSPSQFDLKYSRESTPTQKLSLKDLNKICQSDEHLSNIRQGYEIDPNVQREFLLWKDNPTLDQNNPFIVHMYREDIAQCLDFSNADLVAKVKNAINSENIFIEAVDEAKAVFPKKCALMEVPKQCFYRMKIADSDEWLYISQMCRNRIIAVCNFLNYLRYIQRGLVKSSADDMFWEIIRLRKVMMLSKLGLPIPSVSS